MKIETDDSVAALCIVALVLAMLIASVAVCENYVHAQAVCAD